MDQKRANSIRRIAAVACLLLVTLGVSAAVLYLKDHQYPKRLAVVEQGILYRCSQPDTRQLDNLIETYGIKSLVIVREGSSDYAPNEIEHARKRGLSVTHIPIKSREKVPDDQIKQFFDIVDNPTNRPILVHCSAGRHRTGYLCALYRIERMNWSVDQAAEEMVSFGFDTTDQAVVLDQLKAYRPGEWKRSSIAEQTKSASGKS